MDKIKNFLNKVCLIVVLFFIFFTGESRALEIGQGHYFYNSGLRKTKGHTKLYSYGIGMRFRYSSQLEILGVGLKHLFEKNWSLSWGIENSDTNKYGASYPLHFRVQKDLSNGRLQFHLNDRYFPDFYKDYELHFASSGIRWRQPLALKKSRPLELDMGFEFSHLLNQNHKNFSALYSGLGRQWQNGFTTRVELVKCFKTRDVEHLSEWLGNLTLGFVF